MEKILLVTMAFFAAVVALVFGFRYFIDKAVALELKDYQDQHSIFKIPKKFHNADSQYYKPLLHTRHFLLSVL